jgi:hypothetical protein
MDAFFHGTPQVIDLLVILRETELTDMNKGGGHGG